jgi:hypothetical protein
MIGDNEMLYCLIAFMLGYLLSRHMSNGNGFSIGGQACGPKDNIVYSPDGLKEELYTASTENGVTINEALNNLTDTCKDCLSRFSLSSTKYDVQDCFSSEVIKSPLCNEDSSNYFKLPIFSDRTIKDDQRVGIEEDPVSKIVNAYCGSLTIHAEKSGCHLGRTKMIQELSVATDKAIHDNRCKLPTPPPAPPANNCSDGYYRIGSGKCLPLKIGPNCSKGSKCPDGSDCIGTDKYNNGKCPDFNPEIMKCIGDCKWVSTI